jgi:hypothetical protein
MNKSIKLTLALGVVAAVIADAPSASAATYILTVSGHVVNVGPLDPRYPDLIDKLGVFVDAGTSLGGSAFSIAFRINTSEPWLVTPPEPGSNAQTYQTGINNYFQRGEAIIARTVINGRTVSNIGGDGVSSYGSIGSQSFLSVNKSDGSRANIQIGASTLGGGYSAPLTLGNKSLTNWNLSANLSFVGPPSIANNAYFPNAFSIPLDDAHGSMQFSYSGQAGGKSYGTYAYGIPELATFSTAAVPEPATWAMMLAGFGLTGGVIRKRRGARKAVTA